MSDAYGIASESSVIISSGVTKLKGKTIELAPGTTIGIGAKLEINN